MAMTGHAIIKLRIPYLVHRVHIWLINGSYMVDIWLIYGESSHRLNNVSSPLFVPFPPRKSLHPKTAGRRLPAGHSLGRGEPRQAVNQGRHREGV